MYVRIDTHTTSKAPKAYGCMCRYTYLCICRANAWGFIHKTGETNTDNREREMCVCVLVLMYVCMYACMYVSS